MPFFPVQVSSFNVINLKKFLVVWSWEVASHPVVQISRWLLVVERELGQDYKITEDLIKRQESNI